MECDLSIYPSLYLHTCLFLGVLYFIQLLFSFFHKRKKINKYPEKLTQISIRFFFAVLICFYRLLVCAQFNFRIHFVYLGQGSVLAMAAMDPTNGTTWQKDYTKNDTTIESNEGIRIKGTFFEIIAGQCVRY